MQNETTIDRLISQGFSKTILERFWKRVNKSGPIPAHCTELGPCWEWTGQTSNKGYGVLYKGVHPFQKLTSHRISWMIHYGTIQHGHCVLHKCDNPPCINPGHLKLGTMKDNTQDMIRKGRDKFGHPRLSSEQIIEILSLRGTDTNRNIGLRFGVCQPYISRLFNGQRRKRITLNS